LRPHVVGQALGLDIPLVVVLVDRPELAVVVVDVVFGPLPVELRGVGLVLRVGVHRHEPAGGFVVDRVELNLLRAAAHLQEPGLVVEVPVQALGDVGNLTRHGLGLADRVVGVRHGLGGEPTGGRIGHRRG
jgi:hypothetical protein